MKTCQPVCIVLTAILLLTACGGQRLSDSEILATADAIRAKTPVPKSSKQVDEREFDDEQLDVLEEEYYRELEAAEYDPLLLANEKVSARPSKKSTHWLESSKCDH